MLEAAEKGQFSVLYLESLSRLARNVPQSINLLFKLVHRLKIRVVSIDEGLDTLNPEWELMATLLSAQHAKFIRDLAKAVFRGQSGTVLAGFSVGDYCFGYASVPCPGTSVGRGSHARPRRDYAIDVVKAEYVALVFEWFVEQRWTIRAIARELTRRAVPKNHNSTTRKWHHDQVRGMLRNLKYIGEWKWGKMRTERDSLTGEITRVPRDESETAPFDREFPHLRLIDDEMFFAAQKLLDSSREKYTGRRKKKGQLEGSSDGNRPNHILWQAVRCTVCDGHFQVGGSHGQYLACANHIHGECPVKTLLPRKRAEGAILAAISQRLLANSDWQEEVFQSAMRSYQVAIAQESNEHEIKKRISGLEEKICCLLDALETKDPDPDIQGRIKERRREKLELERTLAQSQRASTMEPPTREWATERLGNLADLLRAGGSTVAFTVRGLIPEGVRVEEIPIANRKRSYLRATFRIFFPAISGQCGGVQDIDPCASWSEEIVIDFRKEPIEVQHSDAVQLLWEQGLQLQDIAERLNIHRNVASKALRHWHVCRGLPMPNVHTRRIEQRLAKKPPLPVLLADEVGELAAQGVLLVEIAEQLQCDRNVVTKAYRHYCEKLGIPKQDGRKRRKSLERKVRSAEPSVADHNGNLGAA